MSPTHLRPDGSPFGAYLVHGEDLGLVSQALSSLLEALAALDGEGLAPIEEYATASRDEPFALGPVLDACRTPPFLAPRRIVVVRDGPLLDAAQTAELLSYVADPLETTVLVLAYGGKSAPAAVQKAIRAAGAVLDAVPSTRARDRSSWFGERLQAAPVHLDQAAATLMREHLGEDLARLEGILATLAGTFGPGARLGREEVAPFLGQEGGVAPWDLTDAIDSPRAKDSTEAIRALHRLLAAGERHPLQVLATLARHYGAMLRLDGSDAHDEKAAAALTGLSPFPAKKALETSRRLGHRRLARAIELLAEADLDLRGRVGWPPELVLELLVARLSQLSRLRPAAGRSG